MADCGIYKIVSTIHPDRCYVGSAVNIGMRWSRHRSDLRKNRHDNKILQCHYNKYGEESFEFSILAICNREELKPIKGIIRPEQFFIWAYNPYFNISPIAGSNWGCKMSQSAKDKLSKSIMGHPGYNKGMPAWNKGLTKKDDARIAQYAKNGTTQFQKGIIPWNKGIKTGPQSKEANEKRSKSLKGHPGWTKGSIPWNKGLTKESDERLLSISQSGGGQFKKGLVPWNKGKKGPKQSQEHINKRLESCKKKREFKKQLNKAA